MRRNIVAGNWKMNNTIEEGKILASEVVNMVNDEVNNEVTVILGTPFVHLLPVVELTKQSNKVFIAAQNCSNHVAGAFTGEVSVTMLKSVGVDFIIIGHSERRQFFNETNAELAQKVDLALAEDITPIFCCGEPLEIREDGSFFDYVCTQLTESLFHLTREQMSKIVLAYEPIWAIGTGKTASAQQAQDMHAKIRSHIASQYGDELANDISILYGGSCKPDNAQELFANPDVDGGLIGGASLKSRDFVDIAKSF
ncbi:MAG: triose-phosphate isomerase [Bacteroidetes bacterium]|nr:MAG: triose-phosphate isomerase [Bacteroidota bacterium]